MILEEMTPPAMQQRLSTLTSLRPEVQTLYFMIGRERLLEWAHSIGISVDGGLRDLAPPVPPLALRSIVAAPEEPVFLWTGLKDAQMCADYLDRHFPPVAGARTRILDFGCGCGRTTRFLQAVQRFRVHGSDVNPDLVGWCQANLDHTDTALNAVAPPFAYEDGAFDFVYSLSIFSHLSERSMAKWISELARITVDNGIVLLTTHGQAAIDTICQSEQHQQMFRLSASQAEQLRSDFPLRQFLHFPYDPDIVASANAGDDYGNAFIHEDYIRDRWTGDAFEVLEFVPAGMRGWQDVTILRRRERR